MDYPKSTRDLLEKYWAAETTPEDEKALRTAMEEDKDGVLGAYFSFLSAESAKSMSSDIGAVKPARRVIMRRAMSIAAAVLLLIAAGFGVQRAMMNDATPGIHTASADSYDDPEQAYEETKQALLLVSAKLNSSRTKAGEQLAKTKPAMDILK